MRTALLLLAFALSTTMVVNAQDPLPNQGFEEWTEHNGNYWEPNNWNSSNQCTELLGTYALTRTEDAHSGTYAVELKTRNSFIPGIRINGVMTTGEIQCIGNGGGQEGGAASTLVPDSIVFWYKYAPVDVDTAYVQVIMFSGVDTVSFTKGQIYEAASTWTRAAFKITTPTGASDTISTFFNSSWGDGGAGEAFVGSIFIVDDVEYSYVTGIEEDEAAAKWEVYPNPVQDVLNVSNQSGKAGVIEILDATGRKVMTQTIAQTQATLNVSALPVGIYLYQLRDLRGEVIRTGKLIRSI